MDGTNQTAEITDRLKLDELALKVYDRIDRSWQTSPTFTQNSGPRQSRWGDRQFRAPQSTSQGLHQTNSFPKSAQISRN